MVYEPLFVFLPWTPQLLEEGLFLYMLRFYSYVLGVYMQMFPTCICSFSDFPQMSLITQVSAQSPALSSPPLHFLSITQFFLFLFLYLPDIILFTYLLPCLFSVLPPPPHSYPLDVSSTETGIDSKHCVHHCLFRIQNST